MNKQLISLSQKWIIGKQVGSGGFGKVYLAKSEKGEEAIAKFIPKAKGAKRELLFVDLGDTQNVIPIIDSGKAEKHWVLVMPRADKSLREHLTSEGKLGVEETTAILSDVATALTGLGKNKVVHRDIKPENILLLKGRWCLTDFGISRYAEATTSPDTHKYSLSPPYAAPERWNNERATEMTDIYSVGIVAYEMLSGVRPFIGPETEDYREQHLHDNPTSLANVPSLLSALVDECLYKAPGARPSTENFQNRLSRIEETPKSEALAKLQQANQAAVAKRAEAEALKSRTRTETERREALMESALRGFTKIADGLRDAITAAAPTVSQSGLPGEPTWTLNLNEAQIGIYGPGQILTNPWGQREAPAFDVITHASVGITIPPDRTGYTGRSHSLWFGDIQEAGQYKWFETAFMISALIPKRRPQTPFALGPGQDSAKAVWTGMAEYQLAWPFTPLETDKLQEFINRWVGWFADAALGKLTLPAQLPEHPSKGTWRTA